MGRKKRNGIYEYYSYDEVTKRSKCLMPECPATLKGKHGANLLRHFHFRHKEVFYQVININKARAKAVNSNSGLNKKDILLKNLTDLITVHGRPVSLLDDDAFGVILSMIPLSKISVEEIKVLVKQAAQTGNVVSKSEQDTAVAASPSITMEDRMADSPEVLDDDALSTIDEQINSQTHSVNVGSVKPSRVKLKRDPLEDEASDCSLDSSEEEEYEVPIQKEVFTQSSRVRERRRSDVVRKNNAIAEYYEAKKMKVCLEIKKMQIEMDIRGERRRKNTNMNSEIIGLEMKTEIE